MAIAFRPAWDAARGRAAEISGAFRRWRFWVELGSLTVLALVTAGLVARSATRRETALRAQFASLRETRAGVNRWIRDYRAPTPDESLVWRQSQHALAELDGRDSNALSVARLVAQRAEKMGITDIHLRFTGVDDAATRTARLVGPWSIAFSDRAILVEFAGDLSSILSFVGVLPPQVEVGSLDVGRDASGGLRARVHLFIRKVGVRA